MEEVWKDIKGHEDKYQVSNTGKVRSKDRFDSAMRIGLKDITACCRGVKNHKTVGGFIFKFG